MKKVKSVAFNVADPIEYALYQHAMKNRYFSTYIKRLIQRDMEDGQKIDFAKYQKGFDKAQLERAEEEAES